MKRYLQALLTVGAGMGAALDCVAQTPPPPGTALPPSYPPPPGYYATPAPPPTYPTYAPEQSYVPRFYLQTDVGGQVTQDTKLKEFFGEPLGPNTKVVFDAGPRFGFLGGWRTCDWFSLEAEFGYMGNHIDTITGASRVDHAYFSNAPFLVNARFTCPPHWWFAPYFGGGLGGTFTTISADDIDIGSTHMDGWASAAAFAYQAFGGFRFKINSHMAVSVSYHYIATTDTSYHADFTSGTSSDHLKLAGTASHVGAAAFEWSF
jgi:opacity protein-like surface antigen